MRALRSLAVLSILASVACTYDNKDEYGCGGCTSAHGVPGSDASPERVDRKARVSRLIVANGANFESFYRPDIEWNREMFSLFGPPLQNDDEADAGTEEDGGGDDADAGIVDAGGSDAGGSDAGENDGGENDASVEAGAEDAEAGAPTGERLIARIAFVGEPPTSITSRVTVRVVLCHTYDERLVGGRCQDAAGRTRAPDKFDAEGTLRTYDAWELDIDAPRLALHATEKTYPAVPARPSGTECY